MELLICRIDSLPILKRMPGTCGVLEVSRHASELFQRDSYSRPPDSEIADKCSG